MKDKIKIPNLIGISGRMGSGKDTVGAIIMGLTSGTNLERSNAFETFKKTGLMPISTNKSPFVIKKFAGKLKDMVCLLIGCSREELENAEFKNKELGDEWMNIFYNAPSGVGRVLVPDSHLNISQGDKLYQKEYLTPRLLLQRLGTDCGRDIIHPNIWVNALFADYIKGLVIVPDRDPNSRFDGSVENEGPYPNWIITDVRFPNELKAIEDRGGLTIRVNTNRAGKLSNHESETALDGAKFDYVIDNSGTIEELIEKVKTILKTEKII